jgi:hypothetical protein
MSVEVMTPYPLDSPLMKAWEAYRATENYKNSKHRALTIWPMLQHDDPGADRKRYSLIPIEDRERYVEGSLWGAFMEGFRSAGGKTSA